jgi:hypothetical protein
MASFEFILKENVLSDNILLLPTKGKIFKGNYIAVIKEYSFQNEWSDKENIKKFRSKDQLLKYIDKKYPEVDYLDFTGTSIEN